MFIAGMLTGFAISMLIIVFVAAASSEESTTWTSEESFHDGSVLVKYVCTTKSENDVITLRFYAPGLYVVRFDNAKFPGDMDDLPLEFTVSITEPTTRVISKWEMPKDIDLTILKDGQAESHEI